MNGHSISEMSAGKLWAASDGKVISIAVDAVAALVGVKKGYRVELHALPGYVFHVEAETGDQAIARAVKVARDEGRKVATDAATFSVLP